MTQRHLMFFGFLVIKKLGKKEPKMNDELAGELIEELAGIKEMLEGIYVQFLALNKEGLAVGVTTKV